jgi:hypothetical protein
MAETNPLRWWRKLKGFCQPPRRFSAKACSSRRTVRLRHGRLSRRADGKRTLQGLRLAQLRLKRAILAHACSGFCPGRLITSFEFPSQDHRVFAAAPIEVWIPARLV